MKIRDLLKIKERPVITVGPQESVVAAVRKLIEHDRGSVPVSNESGVLVGIITERDIVRKCFLRGESLANIKIEEVMTGEVAIGTPDHDLDYAVSVMKQKRIRHIPIVENGRVEGMVSMRDILDLQLSETKAEINYAGLLRHRPSRPVI